MGFFASLAAAVFSPTWENRHRFKGAKGEAQGASGLRLFLPSHYRVMNDLLLPTPYGTTQIDHVVVSNHGIFVIESKNIAGEIHGWADARSWIVRRGSSEYKIYNPLRQNAAHIRALVAATGLPAGLFHSLVFFWSDDCRFKTPVPENVRQTELCSYIKSKRLFLMPKSDVRRAIRLIEAIRIPATRSNLDAHVARLQRRRRRQAAQTHQAESAC